MRNRISAVGFLFQVAAIVVFCSASQAQIGCGFQADAAWQQRVAAFKKTDTLRVLAIWAVADTPSIATNKNLPTFWRDMWDSNPNQPISVPRFYLENSDRKYILNVDPLGTPDSFCIRSTFNPVGFSGGRDFTRNVLLKADSFVNFAPYDRDSDKFIEDGIFICIAYDSAHLGTDILGLTGGGSLDTFVTKDSVGGVPIKIVSNSGVTIRVPTREQGVQLASHEWGHLFGLRDYFAVTSNDWWSSGSFTVMGYTGFQYRSSPFSPFQNHKFIGWKQPIDVNATSYAQQIGNYMSTKQFYRLKRDSIEYFETSYHSQEQQGSSRWEARWPGQGVAIAHIVDTVTSPQSKAVKQFDLELPHGLRDDSAGTFGSKPNDSLGIDSLDLFLPYWNKNPTTHEAGSATCLWPATISGVTKKNFDDKTNPSSRVYQNVSGTWMQRTPSRIAIEDIKINGATASADLLLNAQYGKIASNTTLGPGIVPVIGDLIVESGATLTLSAGSTFKVQQNYDNMRQGFDTTKGEIIVKSGGRLIISGTSGSLVKIVSSRIESLATNNDWRGIIIKSGGSIACSNVVIRHAYAAIATDSGGGISAGTIYKARIGRCKVLGIWVEADTLTISSCRVDSVTAFPGGHAIVLYPGPSGLQPYHTLTNDTVTGSPVGIFIAGSKGPVVGCMVVGGDTCGGIHFDVGIETANQMQLGSGEPVPISNTTITGYWSLASFFNQAAGYPAITSCTLKTSTFCRSPIGIFNYSNSRLKLRRSVVTEWGLTGVRVVGGSNPLSYFNLGIVPTDSGYNSIYTSRSDSNWKYVLIIGTPPTGETLKAEWNCWGCPFPSQQRFSPKVDYQPYDPCPIYVSCLVDPGPKIAAGKDEQTLPRVTSLFQNYPNPFNPTTVIRFYLQRREKVRLEVFNMLGQQVKTFLRGEEFSPGEYTFFWNGRDDGGISLSSGVYLYRLRTDSYSESKKMNFVK